MALLLYFRVSFRGLNEAPVWMNSHLENKILSFPFKHLTGINNSNLRVENKACLPKEAIGICHFDIAKDCKKDIARERWLQRLAKPWWKSFKDLQGSLRILMRIFVRIFIKIFKDPGQDF